MSYFPQSTDKARNQRTEARPTAQCPVRRAPNDFLDYNHGPDSYGRYQRPESCGWNAVSTERGRPH